MLGHVSLPAIPPRPMSSSQNI